MQDGSLQVSFDDGVPPVVRAAGELDQDSCVLFESIINSAFEKPCKSLDLALGDLTFVDSSGLRILMHAALRGEKLGCRVNIVSMNPHLDHILDISGLRHLFHISGVKQPPHEFPQPLGTMEPHSFAVPKEKGACRQVRDQVHEFASKMGFDIMALDDIKLAVGEAVSNAVRHGADCGKDINVNCTNHSERLVVKLKYSSTEFDPHAIPAPTYATAAEGGMGIYFMKLVMDKVHYEFHEGYTELTLEKTLGNRNRE